MEIESWESELLGKPVEAAMERNLWFAGTLVEIIDLFVPYRVKMDGTGEVRGFLRIRKPTANPSHQGTTHLVRRTLDGVVQFPKSQNQGE